MYVIIIIIIIWTSALNGAFSSSFDGVGQIVFPHILQEATHARAYVRMCWGRGGGGREFAFFFYYYLIVLAFAIIYDVYGYTCQSQRHFFHIGPMIQRPSKQLTPSNNSLWNVLSKTDNACYRNTCQEQWV